MVGGVDQLNEIIFQRMAMVVGHRNEVPRRA
jgi:hypothetical protein